MKKNHNNEFPLVSIVAICHNHACYLEETLESIRLQTYPNIELIIINNLKDECEGLIRTWIKKHQIECTFIQNETPKNVNQNANLGLQYCKGEYFQIISCDDVLMLEKIKVQVQTFKKLNDNVACIYGDMVYINENSQIIDRPTKLEQLKTDFPETPILSSLQRELTVECFVPAPTVLLKTVILKEIGGYANEYTIEDWPTWVKLSKNGFKFYLLDQKTVYYRVLQNSLSNSKPLRSYQTILAVIEQNTDFFDTKDIALIKRWYRALIGYKRKGGADTWKKYYLFLKHTQYFALWLFLRLLIPERIRDLLKRV